MNTLEGKVYAMKRLFFVLCGLLAMPAFADVAPFYDDGVGGYADVELTNAGAVAGDEIITEESVSSAPNVRAVRSASRAIPSGVIADAGNGRAVATSRTTASREATMARTAASGRAMGTRPVATRSASQSVGKVSARQPASNATIARAAETQVVQQTVSGGANVTGPTVAARKVGNSSMARSPSISVSSSNTLRTTAETVAEVTANMDSLAELSDYCKSQYTACMDNFCNVLDDNQGRCSCSKNVKNYEKTETALKTATEELQEVAQKIQYIGLTREEIVTLFTQTEAELAMQTNSDTTKLRNDLDRIKNMIVGVKSGSASAIGESSGISLDLSNLLSFNIDSTGFDLTSLFGTTSSNTSSVSNQRGEALYKTAAARCKSAVLTNCSAQGVDTAVIINSYDVEIDKQCILYERNLTDANDQMVSTIRNAKTVLQKARLMVAQQKNQYDLRGCISALDSCMQDDYVCGTDYEECLDPTGKFIVEGEVVVGSEPGLPGGMWGSNGTDLKAASGLYTVWNTTDNKNIWALGTSASPNSYKISNYISDSGQLSETNAKNSTATDILTYLQNKMGYHDNNSGKNFGMCISVLNKCQDYTYSDGDYLPKNSVIEGYMMRALRQIKLSQEAVLNNYASSCLADVNSCLSQNNYSAYNMGSTVSSSTNPSNLAIHACMPIIRTCRSVTIGKSTTDPGANDTSLEDLKAWLDAGIGTLYAEETACGNSTNGGTWEGNTCKCPTAKPNWDKATKTCKAASQ